MIRHARHGQPARPAEGNLTQVGIRQAKATGEHLECEGVERILSSPYPRAMQTASIVSRSVGVPVEVRVDLHNKVRPSERTPPRTDLEKTYGEAVLPDDMPEYWSPGTETGRDVYARLRGETEWLKSLEPVHLRIAVISHAFTLDVMTSMLTDCPPTDKMRFWFDNCSLTLVSCVGGVGRLCYLNLTDHLERRKLIF